MQLKKHIFLTLFILLVAAVFNPVLPSSYDSYNVVEFGAVGSGKILDTHAIQAAIDECSKNGGGTVFFPAGTYLSGTIYMRDHVQLNLGTGAVLLGSVDVDDFPLNKCNSPSYSDKYVGRALIWGEGLKDIAITGNGTIDGQGAAFRDNLPDESEWKKLVTFYDDTTRYQPIARYINRPYIIRLISCRDVLVEEITLLNSPMWMQQYLDCDFVTVQNITVYNHGSYNNDMIDIDCCRNVIISNCYGDSDDDGLTLKSTSDAPTENVTVSNCILSSFCNAIKMGTESSGGFKNITITNCTIRPSSEPILLYGRREGLAGIALELVDGGTLDGVTISNITITGTKAPIFMRLGNRARQYQPTMAKPPVGTFRNVIISNIVASEAGSTGCSITGIPGHPIENVTLSNIKINFVGGGTKQQSRADVPEHEEKYPESTMFGVLPAYGFFCRHVNGLTFRDIDINFNAPEYRPPLICDDVNNLKLFNFNASVSENASAQIILRNSHDVFINECQPPKTDVFLRLEANSNRIKVIGSDLDQVNRPFIFDESIQMSALKVANNLSDKSTLFALLEPLIKRDNFGKVTMKSFTKDSEIRYTLDGSEVTRKSKKYILPITRTGTCIVSAKVFKNELISNSAVLKLKPLPVFKPVISPAYSYFNEYVKVSLECLTPNAEIRYSTDEGIPDEKWSVYRKSFKIKKSTSLFVRAFKKGYKPSEKSVAKYELIQKINGIQYRYYAGKWNYLPDFFELTPQKTGVINQFNLDEIENPKMYYGLMMIGFLDIKQTGNYTFYCGSNDGSKLFIDHILLIENDGTHRFREFSGDIYLTKGLHQIDVHYFQKSELQSLKVSWQRQHFEKRELSAEFLK